MGTILSGTILMILIVIGINSIQTVSAEEMALKFRLEKPIEGVVYSGQWVIVIPLIENLVIFKKGDQQIDFDPDNILTSSREHNDTTYSSANAIFNGAIHFRWPRGYDELLEIYENIPSHDDLEKLKSFLQPFISSVLRKIVGNLSWFECRKGIIVDTDEDLVTAISEKLREEKNPPTPIQRACIQHSVTYMLESVKLPPELENAISQPQVAEYEAVASRKKSEAARYHEEQVGQGKATARRSMIRAINSAPDGLQVEVLHTLQEMANGNNSTIFYGLPPNVANVFKGAGVNPTDQDMGRLASAILTELSRQGFTPNIT